MGDPFSTIITGHGGAAADGGIGGRGGDVHLHSHNYGPESPDTILLLSLPRAPYARYDSARENAPSSCLEGTRVAILKEIISWSESANGERPPVYWLNGLAGIGKSTIAKTVAERTQEKALLGASFFFSRSDGPLRDPRLVLPTLAFQLAQSDSAFRNVIVEALRRDPTLGDKEPLSQFQGLILTPLLKLNPFRRPTVIILDALDECEENGAADILQLVFSHAIRIPFLRIFITSRPQPHLSSVFNKAQNLEKTVLHDIEASVIHQDIRLYISTELAKIPEKLDLRMPVDWATATQMNSLVEKSGKLFVYAATVIRFLGDDRVPDPRGHLSLILNTGSVQDTGATPYSQLDDLYAGVLQSSLSRYNRKENVKRFQIVVGSIVLLREPLPLDSLARFVRYDEEVVEATLRHLHSVIDPPHNIHEAPRIYHPSFLEFIMDPSRCLMKEFVIVPVPQQELRHAIRCFELMGEYLKRDVAGISDPSLLNKEIHWLEWQVRHALPPEVQYACRYWMSHLSHVELGEKTMVKALEMFSMESILWWFEAMSLIGSASTTANIIHDAHRWAMNSECKPIVVTMLSDAYRFILAHREVIREQALHVYHSALAFTPQETALYRVYGKDAKECIKVLQGAESEWPQTLVTLLGHSSWVTSVAFSSDGFLASGSDDCTLWLWDTVSGAPTAHLEGHSNRVTSVAFSPDASHLASGSYDHNLWLWDPISCVPIAKLEGHSDWVMSVAFSPDGLYLVSGSRDCTLWLWDAISGMPISKLEGHHGSVMCVAFSPDGLHLASGSNDCTLRLWDAISHMPIAKLEGHTDWVTSVAFSPDGLCLASGSGDCTIQLWDIVSHMPIAKLEGHSGWVASIAFAPNGMCFASGSHDNTIRLWDTISHASIAKLQAHSNWVTSIAFSPDGLCLASGSHDCSIQLWDITSHIPITKSADHCGTTVVFSPDGLRLVSTSKNGVIWLWDAISGALTAKLEGHSSQVEKLTFSPDGLHLASTSKNGVIWLWDAISGALTAKLEGHSYQVEKLTFSPDGSSLASGSYDSSDYTLSAYYSSDYTLKLWNAMSGTLISELFCCELTRDCWQDMTFTFSPDGSILSLAGSSGEAIGWSLAWKPALQLSSSLIPPTRLSVASPIWSLDGQWIQVAQSKNHHARHICHIPPSYSPDIVVSHPTHHRIAIGCKDGRLIILAAPPNLFNSHLT